MNAAFINCHTKSSSQWWFWCPWWGPKSWQRISVSWALQILIVSLTDRVAEVGRLSSNAKNACNSVVGRTFANFRLKMLFLFVLPKSQTFDNDTVHVQYGTISFYVFRLDFRFPNILFQNPWFSPQIIWRRRPYLHANDLSLVVAEAMIPKIIPIKPECGNEVKL